MVIHVGITFKIDNLLEKLINNYVKELYRRIYDMSSGILSGELVFTVFLDSAIEWMFL